MPIRYPKASRTSLPCERASSATARHRGRTGEASRNPFLCTQSILEEKGEADSLLPSVKAGAFAKAQEECEGAEEDVVQRDSRMLQTLCSRSSPWLIFWSGRNNSDEIYLSTPSAHPQHTFIRTGYTCDGHGTLESMATSCSLLLRLLNSSMMDVRSPIPITSPL